MKQVRRAFAVLLASVWLSLAADARPPELPSLPNHFAPPQPSFTPLATSADDQARHDRVAQLIAAGRHAEAIAIIGRELAKAEQERGPNDLSVAAWSLQLCEVKMLLNELSEAELACKRTLAIQDKVLGPDAPESVDPLVRLAVIATRRDRPHDAPPYLERAVKIAEKVSPPDDPQLTDLREVLAIAYGLDERYDDSLPVYRRVVATRDRVQGPEHPQTVTSLLNLARYAILAESFDEAERAARRAVAAREKQSGPTNPETAEGLSLLAEACVGLARYAEAEKLLARAIAIREKSAGDAFDLAHNVKLQAQMYREMGRYADAEAAAKRAIALYERVAGTTHPLTATAIGELGLLYWEIGRYTEAEPLMKRAIALLDAAGDSRLLAAALNNLGALYDKLGRFDESEALYKRAEAAVGKRFGANHPGVAATLQNLAALYAGQGRYDEAASLYRRALVIFERVKGDHPATASVLANWAKLLDAEDRVAEADAARRRALAILEKTAGQNHPATAAVLSDLAASLAARGKFSEAEPLLRRAAASIEASLGPNHPHLAETLLELAEALSGLGRLPEAEQMANRALAIVEKALGAQHAEYGVALEQLAHVQWRQGRAAAAERTLRRAIAVLKAASGPSDPDLRTVNATLSQVLLALGRPADAVAAIREAIAVQRLRAPALAQQRATGRRHEAQKAESVYALAIEAFFALAKAQPADNDRLLAEAFEAAQFSELDETGEALARMAARFAAGSGPRAQLLREQQDLTNRLARLEPLLSRALSAADPAARAEAGRLRAESAAIETRLSEIDARLKRDHPAYADLVNPSALRLGDVQKLLGEREAVAIHIVTDDATYTIAASANAATWSMSNIGRADMSADVAALREDLNPDRWQSSFEPFDRTRAHRLYRELWAPSQNVLKDKSQVFVVQTGPLASLPFAVLPTEQPAGGDADPNALRATVWLIKRHALTTLPSIASLKALRLYANKGAASEPFAGFGDPILGTARSSASRARSVASLFRGGAPDPNELRMLEPLPATANEIRALAKALGASETADVFLRERATEAQLKSLDLSRKRVIAFATHAFTAGDLGAGEPGLVFTPPSAASGRDDGYLAASEAAELNLRADWIILSACNTAAGDTPGAKGLSGLARAFFLAGARSLLVSHWSVWDDASARITTAAVKSFQANPSQGRAEALRQAALGLMSDGSSPRFAHPAAWAPFVLVGEPRAN